MLSGSSTSSVVARESRVGLGAVAIATARGDEACSRASSIGAEGDREALEELYLIHFDRIYSYLHVTVGNRHDAEDLTTQTFLKMLESIGKFRWQSAPFSAWLFRIAHNLAMDHFRATKRWQPEEEVPEPPSPTSPTVGRGGRARSRSGTSRCSS